MISLQFDSTQSLKGIQEFRSGPKIVMRRFPSLVRANGTVESSHLSCCARH
jgi:hypothetical protein